MNRKQVSNRKEGSLRGNTQPPACKILYKYGPWPGALREIRRTTPQEMLPMYVCMYVTTRNPRLRINARCSSGMMGGGVFDAGVS